LSEQIIKQNKDKNGAEAPSAEFFGAISGKNGSEEIVHRISAYEIHTRGLFV
jgi:hypothetical protein